MQKTNPFPGMNPFMEQRWHDAHHTLIGLIRSTLGQELPDNYSALAEEQVNVRGGHSAAYYPDLSVIDDQWKRGLPPVWTPPEIKGLGESVAQPDIITVETPPERWVEVRHDDGELVTVIEVVSPTNRESGRSAFLAKRRDYLAAGVNVVEVDLLRGGRRLIDLDPAAYQSRYGHLGEHYTACAIRSTLPHRREIYASPLRQPLPVIRIPLRHADPDVPLDLQALVDEVYSTGRYWKLDYHQPLEPLPGADDLNWIQERLAASGLA
jgi:Uma2 family endonuclease